MASGSRVRPEGHSPSGIPEAIAVVGIGALYPAARGTEQYWRLLTAPATDGTPAPAAGGLGDIEVDVARFGIPPAQTGTMARMQVLALEAARQCLQDAGYDRRPLPSDRVDVAVGTCFGLDRQYANALRIEGARYAVELERTLAEHGGDASDASAGTSEEFRAALIRRLGASPHDRVGELVSSIPARVASAFKLRGRTLALESADVTSYLGLAYAMDNLRAGLSDAVLLVVGQRHEGPFVARALAAKGLEEKASTRATAPCDTGPFSEGVGALLVKRLSSAEQDGDRVYATLRSCVLRHEGRPGVFRYPVRAGLWEEAAVAGRTSCAAAEAVQYVEAAGSGVAGESHAEQRALTALFTGAAPGSVAVGSVRDRLGHTFANAGLAGVSKIALALHHRRLPGGGTQSQVPHGGALRAVPMTEDWPAPSGGGPRRAALVGSSLTGTVAHVVMEEHRTSHNRGGAPPEGHRAVTGTGTVSRARPIPIAVVGYGGRFAGCPDAEALWAHTLAGRSMVGPMPDDVFDRSIYYAPGALSLDRSYTDQGASLPVPDGPPPGLRLPPSRYAALDAAQRVALDVAAELLARRGYPPGGLPGSGLVAVGSNLGLHNERRLNSLLCVDVLEQVADGLAALGSLSARTRREVLRLMRDRTVADADFTHALDGCLASGVAALIANEFALDAVPVAVEAACASSLAALDLAVGRLRSGAVDYALAGGVELPCNARDMVLCSSLGLLSHERITPFDESADGFSPGDGCALFLLKRYDDALRDGDPIHGLLRSIGASNDAKSLIAPDIAGQASAMLQAFAQVEFEPSDVDYLEAHGTGTRVGDRVEIAAVAQVYGAVARRRPLDISSAKAFFGHTFAAAGATGLLRALHAVRTATVPPNTSLRNISPDLALDRIPGRIRTDAAPWEAPDGHPRRAAVSSFGTGGINYHLLLEEYQGRPR
ncbi:polyketide synthase [Streptomyces ossamyceticus]|nr:polyketide synthase [Streptomyces ossamyceticus]